MQGIPSAGGPSGRDGRAAAANGCRLMVVAPLLSLVAAVAGCSAEGLDPDAYHWEITVSMTDDQCNPSPVSYQETFTYSLYYEEQGSSVDLRIDGASFATGLISGCTIEYESPVTGEERGEDTWIKWQLHGEATFRPGGYSCDLEDGVDWQGEEVFQVVSSDDPSLSVGCTYTTSVVGVYLENE